MCCCASETWLFDDASKGKSYCDEKWFERMRGSKSQRNSNRNIVRILKQADVSVEDFIDQL